MKWCLFGSSSSFPSMLALGFIHQYFRHTDTSFGVIVDLYAPSQARRVFTTRFLTDFSLSSHSAVASSASWDSSLFFPVTPSMYQCSHQEQAQAQQLPGRISRRHSDHFKSGLVVAHIYQRALVHLLFRGSTTMGHSQGALAPLFHVTSKEIRHIGDYLTSKIWVRILPLLLRGSIHLAAVNGSTFRQHKSNSEPGRMLNA